MGLDELRSILLSERETGKLIAIPTDTFDRVHTGLAALRGKVHTMEDPFSDEAQAQIDETKSIEQTLHDLFVIRSRKILELARVQAEGNYYDREEVKRMILPEREMFNAFIAAIGRCQEILLRNAPPLIEPALSSAEHVHPEPAATVALPETVRAGPAQKAGTAASPPVSYTLVRILDEIDPFMGVDGRIYTLSKGDIVTLPERNAAVLGERNIALNMNLCK